MTKNALKILFLGMSAAMVVLVIVTSLQSNMFRLPECVVNEPWFKTTLVDFYFNIIIISAWVIYRERSVVARVWWVIGFIFLGSIATAFYVFWQLARLRDNEGLEQIFTRKA